MLPTGTAIKRRSIVRADPMLPKRSIRQPSSKGRTTFKQLNSPTEQLKDFKKKELYTRGNLSTDRSQANIHESLVMKQSRFDDDHHHTLSIAELLDSKRHSITKGELSHRRSIVTNQESEDLTVPRGSLQTESIVKTVDEDDGQEIGENLEQKEGENYDDYVLGDKVDDEEAEVPQTKHRKKYLTDDDRPKLQPYMARSESEVRMQQKIINRQRAKLRQLREDAQLNKMLLEYHHNKHQVHVQTRKKLEGARMLTAIRQQRHILKCPSEPAMKPPKKMFVLQQPEQTEAWKKGKDERRKLSILAESCSLEKLNFGRKAVKTLSSQEALEEELMTLEAVKGKLRAKGVTIDSDKLTKGLINVKTLSEGMSSFPSVQLLSNPIYKKFPL